jgi:hypothetical protein
MKTGISPIIPKGIHQEQGVNQYQSVDKNDIACVWKWGIPWDTPNFWSSEKKENHDKQLDFGIPDNPDNIFSQKSNAKGIKLIGPLYVPHFSGSNLAARALNGLGIPTIRQDKPTKTPCLSCLIPPKFCRLGIGVSIIYIYIYTFFLHTYVYIHIYIYIIIYLYMYVVYI